MSIVNISSENRVNAGDTDTDFEIRLQRPLQKIIGLQVLNASIPLTYSVINDSVDVYGNKNNRIFLDEIGSVAERQDKDQWDDYSKHVTLESGTFEIDELCYRLETALNQVASLDNSHTLLQDLPKYRSRKQRQYHIDNRRLIFNVNKSRVYSYLNNNEQLSELSLDELDVGMIIRRVADYSAAPSSNSVRDQLHILTAWDTVNGKITLVEKYADSGTTSDQYQQTSGVTNRDFTADQYQNGDFELVWPGYLVFFDHEIQRVIICNDNQGRKLKGNGSGDVVPKGGTPYDGNELPWQDGDQGGIVQFDLGGNFFTSRRLLKAIGLTSDPVYPWRCNVNVLPGVDYTVDVSKTEAENMEIRGQLRRHKNANLGIYMQLDQVPEPHGPGIVFIRFGGDIILDQQNTENHMNDRIPLPLSVDHGDVCHIEYDAEADLIPLAVPCDISRLKIRVEYGDEGGVLGGADGLNGQHLHIRVKLFKEHQKKGGKM